MSRGDVDDAAAAALLDHLLGGNLRAEEGALEIDRHYLFVLILGRVEDRSARLDPGVVDHNVHPAKLAHRPVDEHPQVGELADIGFDPNRLITELSDLLLERVDRFRMAYIVDDDAGVPPGEFENNRLTDPTHCCRQCRWRPCPLAA
jgi:hypothetical protein